MKSISLCNYIGAIVNRLHKMDTVHTSHSFCKHTLTYLFNIIYALVGACGAGMPFSDTVSWMAMGWWPQVTLGGTRVARGFPATHIRHGADGGLRTSQDRTHEPGHGTWNMDRHAGELEALG